MTIRIGIIGSGFAAQHIKVLKQIEQAQVVAVCARDEQKARQMTTDKSVSYYAFDDYIKMLQQENLDAVYLCVPPFLHGELELACAEYVGAVFVEKPVALELSRAQQMQYKFEKAGTIVSVGYMNRYRANLQQAKKYFSQESPILINAGWCDLMPPPYWWRQREQSGGQLTEQCTHLIDAIRYIAGEVEEVSAYAANGFINDVDDFNVDDAVVLNLRLQSGAIANVMTSCFSKDHGGGALGIFLNICSREKTFRFTDTAMDLNVQNGAGQIDISMSKENPILEENRAFICAIESQDLTLIRSSYEDAIESLKVGFAADLSLQEKRLVKLSEL